MNTPAVQDRLKTVGVTVVAPERRSSDYLKAYVASETAKWAATIKAAGVSLD
jgi:tripartite-type tricarboxylate transporter receptor subunit TctC